jgi:hypothetical protein
MIFRDGSAMHRTSPEALSVVNTMEVRKEDLRPSSQKHETDKRWDPDSLGRTQQHCPHAITDLSCESGYPWDKYEARNDEGQDDSLEEVHHPIRFSTFWFAHLARRHLEVPLCKEAEADAEPNAAVRLT